MELFSQECILTGKKTYRNDTNMESDMFAVTYEGEPGIIVTWRVGTPSL